MLCLFIRLDIPHIYVTKIFVINHESCSGMRTVLLYSIFEGLKQRRLEIIYVQVRGRNRGGFFPQYYPECHLENLREWILILVFHICMRVLFLSCIICGVTK
jgi:hypothetical protein